MSKLNNPSLRQLPRHEQAELIPLNQETSILDWLKVTGRLIARDDEEAILAAGEEEEIDELMGTEDSSYEEEDNADDME